MPTQNVVIDGSNIATEGRSTPSLAQLEDAVRELHKELPDAIITTVVDATFAHRIDPAELPRFEEASLRGEYVSPPAGAIGRGDAFLLRIAEKVDATVLSNDSFQEFHGEHGWLFERGRLLGATPVPGIGWIFVPRTPVRGPCSRTAVRDSARSLARVEKAIAAATAEAVEVPGADDSSPGRRPRRASAAPQAVNDPATFIGFIAEHRPGDEIEAVVESFTSHGAVALFGAVRCYVPLAGLGSPAPRSAREVLRRDEAHRFVITALDAHRRGVELAFKEFAVVSGRPTEETVAAEVAMARGPRKRLAKKAVGGEAVEPAKKAAKKIPATRARKSAAADAKKAAPAKKAAKKASKQTAAKAGERAEAKASNGASKIARNAGDRVKEVPAKAAPAKKTRARGGRRSSEGEDG